MAGTLRLIESSENGKIDAGLADEVSRLDALDECDGMAEGVRPQDKDRVREKAGRRAPRARGLKSVPST